MAVIVSEIIKNAYYFSKVVARDYSHVSGPQMQDGLNMLNEILSLKSANTDLIPYYKKYEFQVLKNVKNYFIPNLVDIETFVFFLNGIRYQSFEQSRKNFYGSSRLENLSVFPITYRPERTLNGMSFDVYPAPALDLDCEIFGKFGFDDVTLYEDVSTIFDLYYIKYITLKLSETIGAQNGITLDAGTQRQLDELEDSLRDVSPPDLTTQKISAETTGQGYGLADYFIGKFWRPPRSGL